MTRAPDRFETPHLTAERLTPAHLADLDRMHQDAGMMATMGGVRSTEETEEYLAINLSHWERHGFGVWILRDRATGALAGRAVLRAQPFDGRPETSLGYALLPECWGRGWATEAARALVAIGSSELGRPSLVAVTLPGNHASQRVLAKVGFTYERDVIHAEVPHRLFRRSDGERLVEGGTR